MRVFEFTNSDVQIGNIKSACFKDNKSLLDELLISEWLKAMNNGCFKFKLDSEIQTKTVESSEGGYSFVYQLNTKRFTEKRKAEPIYSLNKPFDATKFNFTKINENEILFNMVNRGSALGDRDTFVIINNSPIEIGHVLLVPKLHSSQNQRLNEHAIVTAVELSLLSNSYGFLVGFNSLCALASVNHLHLHAYYLDHILPIQKCKAGRLVKNVRLLENYYLPALVLQLADFDNNIEELAKHAFKITDYLTRSEIAHNVVIIKGENFEQNDDASSTLRLIVWPRKAYTGSKDDDTKNITFQLAICELSGHIVIKDEATFNSLKPAEIMEEAKQIHLPPDEFAKILRDLQELFS